LFIAEVAIRLTTRTPIFDFSDLRTARATQNNVNTAIEYDDLLGWRLRPFIASKGFNTIEYGIRSNGPSNAHVRKGGILAVGSSFTAGSEVNDNESWSAHLEALLGNPVTNAGQGGYSADQIILLAERMIPLLQPEVVVVDLLADNILGVGYSSYGMAKPFFTVENAKLVLHNHPVPNTVETGAQSSDGKWILARSIVVDRFMSAFFSDFWFTGGRSTFKRTGVDEVEVTCLLLQSLAAKTGAAGIRLLLYLQYAGSHMIGPTSQPGHSLLVKECAEDADIEVIDEFGVLRSARSRSVEELRSYYVREPDGTTGHKSSFGNLQVAKLIAAALKDAPARRERSPRRPSTGPVVEDAPSEIKNLVPDSERLETVALSVPHAELSRVRSWFSAVRSYRISAKGESGEHYVVIPYIAVEQGSVIASLEAHAEGTPNVRMQLISASDYGAFADFDLKAGTSVPGRFLDTRNVAGGIEPASDGWSRVWVRAAFPVASGAASLIIQLADTAERYGFTPRGESILVRRVQVVRGQSLRDYQPTPPAQKSK
jgi:hypothetical protein